MPAPARADKRFLEMHGTKWRVVVAVPRKAQATIGKTKLKRDLGTDSLAVANRLKPSIVAAFQDQINHALNPGDDLVVAMGLARGRQAAVDAGQDTEGFDSVISHHVAEIAGEPVATDHEGQPVFDPVRDVKAHQFHDIAMGRRTPFDATRPTYLKEITERLKARTVADDVRGFAMLVQWCQATGTPPFKESFKRKQAVAFKDWLKENAEGRSLTTLNKYIVRFGVFWNWMMLRGEVESNVWTGLTYAVPTNADGEDERPFSPEEMVKLLSGGASQAMHDVMRIAALTGCRLDPIVCLRVKDCREDGVFVFKPQKKEKGERLCPIHSDLKEIVERRTEGKGPDEPLFPEWPGPKNTDSLRERSFKTSNEFTEYRRSVGVADEVDGRRRSLVNFHSFRRWFCTKAEQADQPESTIASVVGHKRHGMTLGKYSAGPLIEQARRCVEAVRLPEVPAAIVVEKQRRQRRS